jgi:hypothetical protein
MYLTCDSLHVAEHAKACRTRMLAAVISRALARVDDIIIPRHAIEAVETMG